MPEAKQESDNEQIFTSVIGEGGTPVLVYVKSHRIVRVRPIVFNKDEVKPWRLKVCEHTFIPPEKTCLAPFELAFRKDVYNQKRIKYPLKRIDFNLDGDRHPQNRGKSGFIRITWEEALDIVANEMKRIKKTYGPSAIFYMHSSHHQKSLIHDLHMPPFKNGGLHPRLLSLFGGCTTMLSNPDSWEGWYWGAEHVWGSPCGFWAFGLMEQRDLLEDVMKNSKMLISWSSDAESQTWFDGQDSAIWRIWLKELGIKQISISPELNYEAGLHADKWIPIRPGTDAALAAAIAYIWISEGIYDKKYVYSHGFGFDKWKDYILGVEDGIPKTPKWAEEISGVRAAVTRVLSREWASKPTTLCIRMGAACRVRYGSEWPRMMVLLQAMQGLGKPGVSIWEPNRGAPMDVKLKFPRPLQEFPTAKKTVNPVKQMIWRLYIADAILNPPISWHSLGTAAGFAKLPIEQQFEEYTYPIAGCSEIRMIFRQGSAQLSTWCNTNRLLEAYQSPKIEFIVTQDLWMGGEAPFSDIILPANTVLERNDLVPFGPAGRNYSGAVYMKKCIDSLWESKSDLEIATMLADKLCIKDEFTEGNSEEDWIRKIYTTSGLSSYISYDEFKSKGYFIFPFADDWVRNPGLRWYYEKELGEGLETPSGKIEFFSQRLLKYFQNDKERPAVPKYIESEESRTSERAKRYPLLVESPHPRYRFHTQHAENPWMKEILGYKVSIDEKYYEAIWMNPRDAEVRGIKNGDIVRAFNERGQVLFAAYLTERVMPGVVKVTDGSWYDPLEVGKPYSLDRGGTINLLTPSQVISKNADGMVTNAFLAEVEKWR